MAFRGAEPAVVNDPVGYAQHACLPHHCSRCSVVLAKNLRKALAATSKSIGRCDATRLTGQPFYVLPQHQVHGPLQALPGTTTCLICRAEELAHKTMCGALRRHVEITTCQDATLCREERLAQPISHEGAQAEQLTKEREREEKKKREKERTHRGHK